MMNEILIETAMIACIATFITHVIKKVTGLSNRFTSLLNLISCLILCCTFMPLLFNIDLLNSVFYAMFVATTVQCCTGIAQCFDKGRSEKL